jgi:hypothetical protein
MGDDAVEATGDGVGVVAERVSAGLGAWWLGDAPVVAPHPNSARSVITQLIEICIVTLKLVTV